MVQNDVLWITPLALAKQGIKTIIDIEISRMYKFTRHGPTFRHNKRSPLTKICPGCING